MTKFRKTSDSAAYEIAVGVSAEEAAKLGLAVVEVHPTTGAPTAWGRYTDAPGGSPLGVTVAEPGDTKIVGGGEAAAPAPEPAPVATNLDDPVVKTPPGVETIHADNAPPGKFSDEIVIPQETKPAKKK